MILLESLYIITVIQLFLISGVLAILLMMQRYRRLFGYVSVLSIAVSFLGSLYLGYFCIASGLNDVVYLGSWPMIGFSLSFILDSLSILMMTMVSGLSLVIAVYSTYYMKDEYGFERYFVFYTFFVGSMMLVVSANNLLLLFIGWEGTGLASYALIGHWFRDEKDRMIGDEGRVACGTPMFSLPSMSGLRAILFTRVPDILMLMGIFLILLYTGTLDISELMSNAGEYLNALYVKGVLSIVMVFLILGPFAKSAQFPFHEWLVTAMTGPTPVSALIHAATMVKAGVYFMLRISPFFIEGSRELLLGSTGLGMHVLVEVRSVYLLIGIIGGITAFALATMAIVAREAKLILAYSTASQLGYMFMGIGASAFSGEPGLLLSLVTAHLIAHAIFKAGLFLGAGVLIHEGKSRFIDEWPRLMPGLKNTLLFMWILVLSLAGLPPLIGFWTKDSLIEGVFASGLYVSGILGLITVLITAFYSSRLLLFNKRFNKGEEELHEPPTYVAGTYGLLAILSIILGLLWPFIAYGFHESLSISFLSRIAESHLIGDISKLFLSLLLLGGGLGLSFTAYSTGQIDTRGIARKYKRITDFLYDRWLLNVIYYKFVVKIIFPLSGIVYSYIEKGLDMFYHVLLPGSARIVSEKFRSVQSGDVRKYLLYFILGFMLLLLIIIILFSGGA